MKCVLVTGGAGFIGSHLIDSLVQDGFKVKSVDSLETQVHGTEKPTYLNSRCEYYWGDCGDREILQKILPGTDFVFHLAARVGVAQSMYEIVKYVYKNELSTASLLEEIVRQEVKPKKIIVASSMSIYGEGLYQSQDGKNHFPNARSEEALKNKQWDYIDKETGIELIDKPTPESKPLNPTSIYAIGKRSQEEMVHSIGRVFNMETVACRFFNVFGTRQSLSNPYTGVAAIFCSRILNNLPPLIYEDGFQKRDFVHVSDIVAGLKLCMEPNNNIRHESFNIGSGEAISINEIGVLLCQKLTNGKIQPICSGNYRAGDIRHCYADITKAKSTLKYRPQKSIKYFLEELVEWAKGQNIAADFFDKAYDEGKKKGVIG